MHAACTCLCFAGLTHALTVAATVLLGIRYVRGVRLKFWQKGYSYQRKKVAVDPSHYQNLERTARENRTALLLEDDVGFSAAGDDTDAWYKRLLTTMQELPQVSIPATNSQTKPFWGASTMQLRSPNMHAAVTCHM